MSVRQCKTVSGGRIESACSEKIYFWTLVFTDSCSEADASQAWRELLGRLCKFSPGMRGVWFLKMLPKLPPEGGRFFVHLQLNRALWFNAVRDLAAQCGYGKINVVSCGSETASVMLRYWDQSLWKKEEGTL